MKRSNCLKTKQFPVTSEIQQVPDVSPSSPLVSLHKVPATDNTSPVVFSQHMASGGLPRGTFFKSPDYICRGGDDASGMCPDNNFEVPGSPSSTKRERRPLRCQPFEDSVTADRQTDGSSSHRFTIDDDLDDIEFLARQEDDDRDTEDRYSDVDSCTSTWVTTAKKYDNVMSPSEVTNDNTHRLLPLAQRNVDISDVSMCQLSPDCSPDVSSVCHQYYSATSFASTQDQTTSDVTQTVSCYDSHCDSPLYQSSHLSPGPPRNIVSPRLPSDIVSPQNDNNTRWGKFVDAESKPNTSVSLYHGRFTPHRQVEDVQLQRFTSASPHVLSKSTFDDGSNPEDNSEGGTVLTCDSVICGRSPSLQPENRHQHMQWTGARAGFKPPAIVRQTPERRVDHRGKAMSGGSSFVHLARTPSQVRNNLFFNILIVLVVMYSCADNVCVCIGC